MGVRNVLKEFIPPVVLRSLRRFKRAPAPPTPPPIRPAEHAVTGGDLKGGRLYVNDRMPAFKEMLDGTYDPYIVGACATVDAGEGTVLDIGSHIGYHALCFASRWPRAHVVAFEPGGINVERIQRNLALNPELASRIDLRPIALGDTNGTVRFNISANIEDQTSSGGYMHGASKPLDEAVYRKAGFSGSEVPVRRLDDLVREQAWPRVVLMKVDVEGAEHLVLRGAAELLQRDRPVLLIEVHSVVCMLEVQNLLHPLGYRTVLLHEDRPSRCFILATC